MILHKMPGLDFVKVCLKIPNTERVKQLFAALKNSLH